MKIMITLEHFKSRILHCTIINIIFVQLNFQAVDTGWLALAIGNTICIISLVYNVKAGSHLNPQSTRKNFLKLLCWLVASGTYGGLWVKQLNSTFYWTNNCFHNIFQIHRLFKLIIYVLNYLNIFSLRMN